jgi:hypothetical protein
MASILPRILRPGRVLVATLALAVLVAPSCTRNIPQDKATGKDGKRKGAKKIRIEDGEGRARDTATYPGGDRIDWKKFELPEGPGGKLQIKMKIRPPRPGHTLAMELYDKYYRRLDKTTRKAKRVKKISLKRAEPGTYYVRVYAPKRKDAGDYRLSIRYKERDPEQKDPCEVNPDLPECDDGIPSPPTLPAIPEPDCRKDDDCKQEGAMCVNNKCKLKDPCADMTCPEGQVCQAQGAKGVCVDSGEKPDCIQARLVNYQLSSSGSVIVTLDKGKSAGVGQGWTGQVLVKNTGRPLDGGTFKVTKVTQRQSIGKVRLSLDQLSANRRMKLCP